MQCLKLLWMLRLLTKGSRDTKSKVLFQSSTNKLIFALACLILKTRKVYLRIKSAVSPETHFFYFRRKVNCCTASGDWLQKSMLSDLHNISDSDSNISFTALCCVVSTKQEGVDFIPYFALTQTFALLVLITYKV